MEYNLYNPIRNQEKFSDKFNMIFIEYEEYVRGDYKHITAHSGIDDSKKIYSSGDVIKDFADARDYLDQNGLATILSSGIDNFIMDNKGDYTFDPDTFILAKKVRKPRSKKVK